MAARTLPVLSHPQFPQVFAQAISRQFERVNLVANLVRCDWADEHCNCRELGTVYHIPTELEFCERHFAMVMEVYGE
jgi:hypothetical protein